MLLLLRRVLCRRALANHVRRVEDALTPAEQRVEREVARLLADQLRGGLSHDPVGKERGHLHAEGGAHAGRAVPPCPLGAALFLFLLFFVGLLLLPQLGPVALPGRHLSQSLHQTTGVVGRYHGRRATATFSIARRGLVGNASGLLALLSRITVLLAPRGTVGRGHLGQHHPVPVGGHLDGAPRRTPPAQLLRVSRGQPGKGRLVEHDPGPEPHALVAGHDDRPVRSALVVGQQRAEVGVDVGGRGPDVVADPGRQSGRPDLGGDAGDVEGGAGAAAGEGRHDRGRGGQGGRLGGSAPAPATRGCRWSCRCRRHALVIHRWNLDEK